MDRDGSSSSSSCHGLWTHPLQVPSRSSNDVQETAILSSIGALGDRTSSGSSSTRLLKRTRTATAAAQGEDNRRAAAAATSDEPTQYHYQAARPLLPPSTTMEPLTLKPIFQLRSLSLDRGAIAPGLATPTAPFAKSTRKKAYVSAIYYSECFLRNIQPREADLAAFDIQNQYTKWWVHSKKQSSSSSSSSASYSSVSETSCRGSLSRSSKRKRRRIVSETLLHVEEDKPNDKSTAAATTTTTTYPSLDDPKAATQSPPSPPSPPSPSIPNSWDPEVVNLIKERLIEHMQKTGGDTSTSEFQRCLEHLRAAYGASRLVQQQQQQQQQETSNLATTNNKQDGTWLTLSKPTFSECQGRNENGEYLYTLGRMSFDMFRPTNLRCSIRAIMNNIRIMDPKSKPQSFPSRLSKQLKKENTTIIRHYDIVVAFTIQPNQTRHGREPTDDEKEFVIPRPIRGLMTNHGYIVADPDQPGRRSTIWFSGGSMEVQDEIADAEVWKQIFDEALVPRRDPKAIANLLAAKLLLGAHTTTTTTGHNNNNQEESVPTMSYFFKRPIGGHGEVYCDDLYVDETLRITQGHHGSIFVSTRVPILQEPPAI